MPAEQNQAGVTCAVCCHNSAGRLARTLSFLAAQQAPPQLPWEVIVIDNGSTDDTAAVAVAKWPASAPAPLRVVSEPDLGLSFARRRALAEARYEFVTFIDDDNWVCPDWVRLTFEILSENPKIGACGGASEAACESSPPAWFERYKDHYAIGPQASESGDVTDSRGWLWGAGLTLRRSAWFALIDSGFSFQLADRQGKKLSSGGDVELCLALRLRGWRLWYDDRLKFQHYVPANRLDWRYFRRMCRGCGATTVVTDIFAFALSDTLPQHKKNWLWQTLAALKGMLTMPAKLVASMFLPLEGDGQVATIEGFKGRISELLRLRGGFERRIKLLAQQSREPHGQPMI